MSHNGNGKAKSNPELSLSIDGLNHFNQRFGANNGNQFSLEPPDQGLCVGNGFVLETLNDVLRIYDTAGNPLTGPIDLNSFYGYAAAIDRTKNPLQFGPSITDPSCTFDTRTQRWFHVVLTLDRANIFTQGLSGANHLDIAVSATASPLGPWNIYSLPVQDDGTQGHSRPPLHAGQKPRPRTLPRRLSAPRCRCQRLLSHHQRVQPSFARLPRCADLRILQGPVGCRRILGDGNTVRHRGLEPGCSAGREPGIYRFGQCCQRGTSSKGVMAGQSTS
jgi:hypothetical protein